MLLIGTPTGSGSKIIPHLRERIKTTFGLDAADMPDIPFAGGILQTSVAPTSAIELVAAALSEPLPKERLHQLERDIQIQLTSVDRDAPLLAWLEQQKRINQLHSDLAVATIAWPSLQSCIAKHLVIYAKEVLGKIIYLKNKE